MAKTKKPARASRHLDAPVRNFRVELTAENANPFTPNYKMLAPIETAVIKATSADAVRKFFDEAKRDGSPSVRGKKILRVVEIPNAAGQTPAAKKEVCHE